MGVKNLSQLFKDDNSYVRKIIKLDELRNKILGFDAFNQLFQFLATIRDFQGNVMEDTEGRVTSHLIGLLTRNCNLLQYNITPVYVFDGKSHELKNQEQKRRRDAREKAEVEYQHALDVGDIKRARQLAQRVNKLSPEIIDDAKHLLDAMGIPWIDAPGEGEAQAAYLTKIGIFNATASQDYDTLLFGSPTMVRNVTISGRKKMYGREVTIHPEMYQLDDVLRALDVSHEQLIDIGILIGTDFNPEGFPGIGPKTAYKEIKKYGSIEKVAENNSKVDLENVPYEEIRKIFLDPNVDVNLRPNTTVNFDVEKINTFLKSRNFDVDRYANLLNKTAREIKLNNNSTTVDDWF